MSKLQETTDWLASRLDSESDVEKDIIRQALKTYGDSLKPKSTTNHELEKNFLLLFNKITNGRRKTLGEKGRRQLNARAGEGFSLDDFGIAIHNAIQDNFHVESNLRYVTPEYITRGHILDRYLNMKIELSLDDFDIPTRQKMIMSVDTLRKKCLAGEFKRKTK